MLFGGAVYLGAWIALAVPAWTAWTRLSSYGTTLAAPDQVVEQAFRRAWAGSFWAVARERFWSLPGLDEPWLLLLVGGAFLWLGCFALVAPLLRR